MRFRSKRAEYQRQYMAVRYARAKAFSDSVMCFMLCYLCGEDHRAVKEYHHIVPVYRTQSSKKRSILTMHSNKFHQEIRKCVVLCANCHKKVHADDRTIDVDLTEYWSHIY